MQFSNLMVRTTAAEQGIDPPSRPLVADFLPGGSNYPAHDRGGTENALPLCLSKHLHPFKWNHLNG
jgi:hypothetical protein